MARPGEPLRRDTWVIHGRVGEKFVRILLDTGCSSMFASTKFVAKHKFPTTDIPGMKFTLADESQLIVDKLTTLPLRIYDENTSRNVLLGDFPFIVADSPHDITLGTPFFELFAKSEIDFLGPEWKIHLKAPQVTKEVFTVKLQPASRKWERDLRYAAASGMDKHPHFRPSRVQTVSYKKFHRNVKKGAFTHAWEVRGLFHEATADEFDGWQGNPEKLRDVLRKYTDTLFRENKELPPDRGDDNFRIELLPGAQPVWQPLRHMSKEELDELRTQIQDLLEKGWIRHSTSPWGAAVVFAKKKDGGIRVCWDYRGLNALTKKDRTPLPNIREMRDRISKSKYFTIIDIKDAYHRILIREEDREKTAVRTRFGHFEYVVMPFGLTNAPATFQRLINKLLGHMYDICVSSYLDDILIHSQTLEDHREHVDRVLEILTEAKLYVKPSKCIFAVPNVEFCGHIVGQNGIQISPKKLEAVKNWPTPRSIRDVQAFLGFANYFLDFIPDYAEKAKGLSAIQSNKAKFIWGQDQQTSFDALRNVLIEGPVLAIFDPDQPTYVFTDSSGFAVGGWLAQGDHGVEIPKPLPKLVRDWKKMPALRPITFFSRKMKPAETRYPVHEQELLALVKFLRANRPYLIGRPFRAFTDHHSLIYLQKQPHLSRRQAAWVETIQEFDMEIEYIEGRWNRVADFLSRNPSYAPRCVDCRRRLELAAFLDGNEYGVAELSQDAYTRSLQEDPLYEWIQEALTKEPHEKSSEQQRYSEIDKKIYYDTIRLYVPLSIRSDIMEQYHDNAVDGGHFGIRRTMAKVMKDYYWPNMTKDILTYVTSCPTCRRFKDDYRKFGFLRPLPIPLGRWHTVGFDLFSIGKNATAICFVDYLSSRVILAPTMANATAKDLALLFMDRLVKNFGAPSLVISDREPRALSDLFEAFSDMIGFHHEFATARHQQTDGKCERMIKTVKSAMARYLNHVGSNWKELLPILEFNLNNSPRKDLDGLTPFQIDLGREIQPPGMVVKPEWLPILRAPDRLVLQGIQEAQEEIARIVQNELQRMQDRYAKYYDQRRQVIHYQPGDLVELNRSGLTLELDVAKGPKLGARWIGPFKILREGPHPDTYLLDLQQTKLSGIWPYFHVNVLRPHISPEHPLRKEIPPPPVIIEGVPEYYPEAIIDEKKVRGKRFLLVKWKGYVEMTWEPEENFIQTDVYRIWRQTHPPL